MLLPGFDEGFHKGWEASKVVDWTPFHELEESAAIMRRAEEYESLGYWCGLKSGQEYHGSLAEKHYGYVDDDGMLTSYDYTL